MNEQMTASGKKNPAALPALIPAMWTFGATPTMPKPFDAAAIVPAVCVPWPLSSCAAVPGTGAPLTQLALFATSMLALRSGWLKSIPVSMSPTRTAGLPPVIACASGVWICRMSHWSDDRESVSVAGELGRPPAGGPESVDELVADSTSDSWVANAAVDAAFWMVESLSRLSRNDGLLELAIATPISGYAYTSVPPAFWMVA